MTDDTQTGRVVQKCGLHFCEKEIPEGRISRFCSDFCALKAQRAYGTYNVRDEQ